MKWPILLFVSAVISFSATAQVKQETGDLFNQVSSIISSMPANSGNEYNSPSQSELTSWGSTLYHMLEGNYNRAADSASVLHYSVVEYTDTVSADTPRSFYVLRSDSINYWGTFIYNPANCRELVIQSPHPKYDFNTGKQGIHVFLESNALFFFLSGTHRCNDTAYTICDGTSTVCGPSENYRISDQAHGVFNTFQTTTDTLLGRFEQLHFIQLHGFTKLVSDPYLILSNGTQHTPTPDLLSEFANHLELEDTSLSFKIAHVDTSWSRLRGFVNTQGRLINGSSDPCDNNALSSTGRFFHVEQEKTKLRDDEARWNKVANALNATFECKQDSVSTASPLELTKTKALTVFPNPTQDKLWINTTETVKVYNVLGEDLSAVARIKKVGLFTQMEIGHFFPGLYLIRSNNSAISICKQ